MSTEEQNIVARTGFIPEAVLNGAMQEINTIIKRKFSKFVRSMNPGTDCRKHKAGKCEFKHDEPVTAFNASTKNLQQSIEDDFGGFIVTSNETWKFPRDCENEVDNFLSDNTFSSLYVLCKFVMTLIAMITLCTQRLRGV